MNSCWVCGFKLVEKHRIVEGRFGGPYADWNVVHLCPNHHTATHKILKSIWDGKLDHDLRYDQELVWLLRDPALKSFIVGLLSPVMKCWNTHIDLGNVVRKISDGHPPLFPSWDNSKQFEVIDECIRFREQWTADRNRGRVA